MKLDILIPQYNEGDDIVRNLLDSIASQQDIDYQSIHVIICNDGSNTHLTNELINSYPFHIDYYLEEHEGVAANRNKLLEHSTAEYIMFCDADDYINYDHALSDIMNIDSDFDYLYSDFHEESETGEMKLLVNNTYQLHGKVIKRDLIDKHNIWFNEELSITEDTCFLNLVRTYASDKTIKYNNPFYVWKYNSNSITRTVTNLFWNNLPNIIKSNKFTVETFLDNGDMKLAQEYFAGNLYFCYFFFNREEWKSIDHRVSTEKYLCQYIKEYAYVWTSMKKEYKKSLFEHTKKDAYMNYGDVVNPPIKFEDWLKSIQKKYNSK